MSNLDLWDKVEKRLTRPTLNSANVRGNKITAIAPRSVKLRMPLSSLGYTARIGVLEPISFDYNLVELTGIVVFHGVFFFPKAEFPITSSISAYKDGA